MAKTRTTPRRSAQANPQPNPLQLLSQKGAKKQAQAQKGARRRNNPTHSGGSGVKRMRLSKRQTAKWKIKRLSPPPRNINVNKRGQLVRKMIVRRTAIYPEVAGGNY